MKKEERTTLPSILSRVAIAAGAALGALAISLFLRPYIGNAQFVFFVAAITVTAWLAGSWAALFVVLFAVLTVNWFLMEPRGQLNLDAKSVITMGIFAGVGFLISWIADRMRHAEALATERARMLEEQAVELETQLEENQALTSELESANVELETTVTEANQARAAADEANRAKSEFLAVMSHELRTPLNAIVGYTDLLQTEVTGPLTPAQRTQLERVRASSWHLLDLIQDVLSFARIEAGRETLRFGDIDAAAVARDVVEYLAKTADDKRLKIETELPESPVVIITVPAKLRLILLNLLTNAVKFTDEGAVTLKLRPDGETVEFEVSDTGRGIDGDDHERIFEPFTQVDQTMTRDKGGVGLGLPVSRRLAHLLGGTLTLTSKLGAGASFRLRLPINAAR